MKFFNPLPNETDDEYVFRIRRMAETVLFWVVVISLSLSIIVAFAAVTLRVVEYMLP